MNDIVKRISAYGLLSIGIALVFYNIIGSDLFNLNSVQFDTSGDGFKNYFSFAYQYKYGSGIHFDGLLYPFGDMALYADGQILLVWILQGFRYIGFDLSSELIGFINLLPIVSFYIAAISMYHIYLHYKVPWLLSIVFAIVAMALSPQLLRMQSHFALSYPLIPILWFYIIKCGDKWSLIASSVCIVTIALTGFIHPYHVFILCTFVLLLSLSTALIERSINYSLFTISVLPMLIFYIILRRIDPYDDRPTNPFGLEYHNTIWGDLLPYYGWFRDCFEGIVVYRHYYSEGYAYVGVLFLLLPFYLIYIKLWRRRITQVYKIDFPFRFLLTGLFAVFLGAGLHVLFTGGLILEILTPLKQFRGLGRLSWIYYYLIFVYLSVGFYQIWSITKRSTLKYIIMGVVILLWLYEGHQYHQTIASNYREFSTQNHFEKRFIIKELLSAQNFSHESFQAIYTLPASTEGVEKIDVHDDWHTKMYAMEYAYQTGLALTACVMSRSPVGTVLKIQQLSNPYYHQKQLLGADNKPFLLLIQNERIQEYQDIIVNAEFINKNENISLYQVDLDDLLSYQTLDETFLVHIIDLQSTTLYAEGILFEDFETNNHVQGLIGKGAYFIKEGRQTLVEDTILLTEEKDYEVSAWYKIESDDSGIPVFYLHGDDSEGRQVLYKEFRDFNSGRLMVHDDWIRLKVPLKIGKEVTKITLQVKGQNNTIDKVLICPIDKTVISDTTDDSLKYVNHHIIHL